MNSPRTDSQELCGTRGAELEGLELWPKPWGPRLWQAKVFLPSNPPCCPSSQHFGLTLSNVDRPDPTVLFDPRPQSQKTVGSLGAGLWSYLPLILQGPPRPGSVLSGTIQLMCVEFKKALKKFFFVSKLRSVLCTPRQCVFLLSALLSARWMWTQQQLPRLSPSASH